MYIYMYMYIRYHVRVLYAINLNPFEIEVVVVVRGPKYVIPIRDNQSQAERIGEDYSGNRLEF